MSRLKRFFRRKPDPLPPPPPYEPEKFVYRRPEFRHSLYEDASYGASPETGTRPLKGNGTSVSRRSSLYAQSAYDGNRDAWDSERDYPPLPQNPYGSNRGDEVDRVVHHMSRTSLNEQRALQQHQPSTGDLRARRPVSSAAYGRHLPKEHHHMEQQQREHRSSRSKDWPLPSEIVDRAGYDSVDTQLTKKMAPAVTHETVHQQVHEVREEMVTREVHNHDIYHRILPIVDVEVLPARHFKQEGSKLVEMKPEEIPGRARHWVIAETLSEGADHNSKAGRRNFTARKFEGTDGDAKRYITPGGVEKTEQTWVHPPVLETGAKATGQTVPLQL